MNIGFRERNITMNIKSFSLPPENIFKRQNGYRKTVQKTILNCD